MNFLFEGDGFVAIDKPAGVYSIRPRKGGTNIVSEVGQATGENAEAIHRLDKNTSGVLLVALRPQAHRELSTLFEKRQIQKAYYAIVEGELKGTHVITAPIVEVRKGESRVSSEGKSARTIVNVVERFKTATLVEAWPLEGRHHQIRVHLKHLGHPLIFDHQYNKKASELISRTPLHCSELSFTYQDRRFKIQSPLPEDMAKAIEVLRAL